MVKVNVSYSCGHVRVVEWERIGNRTEGECQQVEHYPCSDCREGGVVTVADTVYGAGDSQPSKLTSVPLSRELRSAIYQAARAKVQGAAPLFEAGLRYTADGELTANALLWAEDADLVDFIQLANLNSLDLCAGDCRLCELDLYATTGTGHNRELETNVTVVIANGEKVVDAYGVAETVRRGVEEMRKDAQDRARQEAEEARGWVHPLGGPLPEA